MNTQAENARTLGPWSAVPMANAGEWPLAICLTPSNMLFCASWNGTSGYLERLVSQKMAAIPGAAFSNDVSGICTDQKGNVYVANDIVDKKHVVRQYSTSNSTWSLVGQGFDYHISNIVCGMDNALYIAGNIGQGNAIAVMKLDGSQWVELPDAGFTGPVLAMCIDQGNNIYTIYMDNASGNVCFTWYNGTSWTPVAIQGLDTNTSALVCDVYGNVYFNNTKTVMSYNIGSGQWKDLVAGLPTQGTSAEYLYWGDGCLYLAGTVSIGAVARQCYAKFYDNGAWQDIDTSAINQGKTTVFYGIAGYTGKSNHVFLACNQAYLPAAEVPL